MIDTNSDWFTDARFGMFIHWGLYSIPARHEWVQHLEGILPEDYRQYFDRFDPDCFDPHSWANIAHACGMKYVVFTAKHHDGFCLWDSSHTEFKSTNTPAGTDLLRQTLESFRSHGIRTGLYYSLIDWHHPNFTIDSLHPLSKHPNHPAHQDARTQALYAEFMRDQLTELLTNYGDIDILWFDFSYPHRIHWPTDLPHQWVGKSGEDWEAQKLWDLAKQLRPSILINDRLGVDALWDFTTAEQFVPAEGVRKEGKTVLWEACHTLSGSWGCNRDELSWKTPAQIIRLLVDTVSKGGNFILNVGPDARGQLDPRAVAALEGIARWMNRHAETIHSCGSPPPELPPPPRDCRYTWNQATNTLYAHCFAWPFPFLELPGLRGRVKNASMVADGSELRVFPRNDHFNQCCAGTSADQSEFLELPVAPSDPDVSVIKIKLANLA